MEIIPSIFLHSGASAERQEAEEAVALGVTPSKGQKGYQDSRDSGTFTNDHGLSWRRRKEVEWMISLAA